jgi:LysM repeat protein
MKRRTRLISIGCAIAGTVPISAHTASASPNQPQFVSLDKSSPVPPAETAARTSTALPRVTVQPGDTLSAIGVRTSRTSQQLAGYNHVFNPNLIYPDQILIIPPASYIPAATTSVAQSSREDPSTVTSTQAARSSSASAPQASGVPASGVWACIASHESGGNPSTNSGNGYYGMYQDTQSSWVAAGGLAYAPRADLASAAAQTLVNHRVQAQQGWGAWPVTSAMCGA